MNNVVEIGRLTRDPEYTTKSGDKSQYVKFTIAVDNEYGDLTSFFDCIAFGTLADLINKYLSKGRLVAVRGRMEQGEPYTDKNGSKRRSWTLKVEKCKFLDKADNKSKSDDLGDSWQQLDEDNPFEV